MCTPTGSRWTSNNYITRCHRRLGAVGVPVAVGDKMLAWEQLVDWGFVALRTHGWAPQQNEEEVLLWSKKNFGSICSNLSPSPTHLLHFMCKRYIFINKCVRFVHWNLHYVSAFICMYMSIQHYPQYCRLYPLNMCKASPSTKIRTLGMIVNFVQCV